jgi:DNA polymerase III delta prime subunit
MSQANFFHELMKTQMMMSLGSTVGNSPLYNLIAFNLYERIVTSYPTWFPNVKAFCCRRQRIKSATEPPPSNKEIKCTIICERIMQSSNNKNQPQQQSTSLTRMDAVVNYVTTIPVIRNLLCITQHDYLPHEFEPIMVEPDIYFQLMDLKHDDGIPSLIKFKLFCYDHEVQYLQSFVDKCNAAYERRMKNKLGTDLYFFDMMTNSKNKRTTQNTLPTTHIMYSQHKFHTTRTFDNVFFEQRPKVKKHVEFFLTRKDWYEKKGIPYTLGFMFHGDPGCGKTSTVKAIANTARRHIINIQLSEIKSKAQLRHLFFNEEIHVMNGQTTERYTIPIHERLYLIEDIDAMGDSVLERKWKKPEVPKSEKKKTGDPWMDKEEEDSKETIDLSFLLNLLDGTLEASGRILCISSNFPERIDKALIRPGRVDMIVNFKKCNRQILKEMVSSFYDQDIEDWTDETMDYKWTPAEVNQILFRNFDKSEDAIQELINLNPKDLYGFDSVENGISYVDFVENKNSNE